MVTTEFTNRYCTIRVGDRVVLSPKVRSGDSMNNYVDEEHPTLEVMKILNGSMGDNAEIVLRSWDGRETRRVGWSMVEISAANGCAFCTSQCKRDKPCEFFERGVDMEL